MNALRDGSWLTVWRINAGALLLLAAYGAYLVWLLGGTDGIFDRGGLPLGAEFARVWSSGRLVLEGRPEAAFDPGVHRAYQQALLGAAPDVFFGWQYPPMFLATAGLLAAFPYPTALVGFVLMTVSLYLAAIERICQNTGIAVPTQYLVAAAYAAAFACIAPGHDGLLSAALLGSGLAVLPTRPLLGGVLIGLLAYAPHGGLLLLPVALMAAGWSRALAAATATIAVMGIASVGLFGVKSWAAFFVFAPSVRDASLENVLALAMLGLLTAWLWRSPGSTAQKAAGLLFAVALATPPAFHGAGLVLTGPAIAFLVADGLARGFAPYEKSLLALIWFAPLVCGPLSVLSHLPVETLVCSGALSALLLKVYGATATVAGDLVRA